MFNVDLYELYIDSILVLVLFIIFLMLFYSRTEPVISKTSGWSFVLVGFYFIFFSSVYRVAEKALLLSGGNFLVNPEYRIFLERFGILFGAFLIAVGVIKWIPKIIEHEKRLLAKLNKTEQPVSVCYSCCKVLNSKGKWVKFETFIKESGEKKIRNCLCPACAAKKTSH